MTVRADILTNHDAWYECQLGLILGHTVNETSASTGISCQMVRNYRLMAEPPRKRAISNRWREQQAAMPCADCGGPRAHSARRGTSDEGRCRSCAHEHNEKRSAEKRRALRAEAQRLGYVPTVTEAALLLGCARGYAGDLIYDEFGPDTRGDGHARRGRRPLEAAS